MDVTDYHAHNCANMVGSGSEPKTQAGTRLQPLHRFVYPPAARKTRLERRSVKMPHNLLHHYQDALASCDAPLTQMTRNYGYIPHLLTQESSCHLSCDLLDFEKSSTGKYNISCHALRKDEHTWTGRYNICSHRALNVRSPASSFC